jgi:protein-S-isoprenylcysteine O-methyltransferase Ste14
MLAIPDFEIGVWNAWIPMLVSLIPVFFIPLFAKNREKGANFTAVFNNRQKGAHVSLHMIYILLAIYSIFLPLKLWTVWFYTGLAICLLGLVMYMIGFVNIAMAPPDKVVTKGIYRFTRHPMYLTSFLVFIGAGIASASWIFLLLSIVYVIMVPIFIGAEERFCLQHYGDTYRDYMARTPRWLGLPKS